MMKRRLYADYDFETAYQEQIAKLEEAEAERYAKRNPGKAYLTKTTKAGDHLEVDIYPAYGSRKDMPRIKGKGTRKTQKNLNERKARRYLNNLADANFGEGDLWCTFTYDDAHLPEDIDAAQKYFTNFIRRVNRRRKKAGQENVKYICVTEYVNEEGEKVRCHHHAIMSGDIDRDLLEDLWKGGGRNQVRRIVPDPETNIAGITHYITKIPKDPKRRKGKKRWTSSRNLKKPEVTRSFTKFGKRTVTRMAFDKDFMDNRILVEYPAYKLIDAQVRINEINGGFYIYARMVKKEMTHGEHQRADRSDQGRSGRRKSSPGRSGISGSKGGKYRSDTPRQGRLKV